MALEQSINLDSKSKGCIVGISLDVGALQRWFSTNHKRVAFASMVKQMFGIRTKLASTRKQTLRV